MPILPQNFLAVSPPGSLIVLWSRMSAVAGQGREFHFTTGLELEVLIAFAKRMNSEPMGVWGAFPSTLDSMPGSMC